LVSFLLISAKHIFEEFPALFDSRPNEFIPYFNKFSAIVYNGYQISGILNIQNFP
jgi:hypothetical protein